MRLDLLQALNAERAARRGAIVVTDLATGEGTLVRPGEPAPEGLGDEIAARFRLGKSGRVAGPAGDLFLTVHLPPPRLVVIGAVHISQALSPMARLAGFDVTVVDPRTAFATPERFPDVEVLAEWPQDALPRLGVDRYTALAALTHDPKVDDPALAHAFERGCFYIGALGSRKTHARRVERLRVLGIGEDAIARMDAPIGLDIGAQGPAEIAVAVLASVIEALRRGEAPS